MPPFPSLLGFWPAAFPAEGVSGLFLAPGAGFTPLRLAYATQTLLPSISQSSMASFAALQFSSVSKSTKPNLGEGRQNKNKNMLEKKTFLQDRFISLRNRHTDLFETPDSLATILAATVPSKAFLRVSVVVCSARPITISVLDRTEEENTFSLFLHVLQVNNSHSNSSRDEQFPNDMYMSGHMACYKYCNVNRKINDWHNIHLQHMGSPTVGLNKKGIPFIL